MSTPDKPTTVAKPTKVATVTPLANARSARTATKTTKAAPVKAAAAKAAPVKATNGKNGKPATAKPGKPDHSTVRGDLLRSALLAALPHTAEDDDIDPVLASVCLAVTTDGRLIAYATDKVNAIRIVPAHAVIIAGKPFKALIPALSIDDLAKRLRRGKDGPVRLRIGPHNGGGKPHLHVHVERNHDQTTVKLTDGAFPDVDQLISQAPARSSLTEPIVVDPDRLGVFGESAVCFSELPARMRLFFTGPINPIRVEIDKLDQAEIVGLVAPMKPTT